MCSMVVLCCREERDDGTHKHTLCENIPLATHVVDGGATTRRMFVCVWGGVKKRHDTVNKRTVVQARERVRNGRHIARRGLYIDIHASKDVRKCSR